MAKIIGQIESLKTIKLKLKQNGIDRFSSIKDIQDFLKNFDSEKEEIIKQFEKELIDEIENLKTKVKLNQEKLTNSKYDLSVKLEVKIDFNLKRIDQLQTKGNKNLLLKILYFFKVKRLINKTFYLQNNFDQIINNSTKKHENTISRDIKIIEELTSNKQKIIIERSQYKINTLESTRNVVEGLNTLIAGAIGENLVVKELEKLPDKYILFNDFSMKFETPIFNKKENDRIFSIQIDHLLVANSGIFILETKNWSKKSIENLDLRSPVKQILRTSHALFVILNRDSRHKAIGLNSHHWGNKQIPVRNIVVMINEKPKEEFKYVKVKTLNELYGYITFFDSIFSDSEVQSISEYLSMRMN
jgi:hypothetical protein